MLGLPAGSEWLILLVVALLLFGGSRLAGMGKGAGRAIREFKEEVKGIDGDKPATGEIENVEPTPTTTTTTKAAEPVAEQRKDI